MATVYEVKQGDSPWKLAEYRVKQQNGGNATNQQIAKELQKLPSIYGCRSMEEFQKKYFNRAGTKIQINFSSNGNNRTENRRRISQSNDPRSRRDSIPHRRDSNGIEICDAIRTDSNVQLRRQMLDSDRQYRQSRHDSITRRGNNVTSLPTGATLAQLAEDARAKNWSEIKAKQDSINNLSSNKDKIIAYNRDIGHIKDNYIIVDKKNYTATVYSPDGKVVKAYEIGVSDNVSDQLVEGNGRGGWKTRATSAGIYTANYRGSGRDAYRRTYNNRILTLSNDGLKEKGVGNGSGETGVALHQVPNGRGGQARAAKLRRPGVSAENNRFSAGCVNFLPEEFDDCMTHVQGVGTKVYILPEDDNNYFCVKNGQLHFAQKNYTGNVATTSTKRDPVRRIRITSTDSDMRSEGVTMARTLSVQKESLARNLGIDNDTYNMLALKTLGIAGAETKYGDPWANIGELKPYWLKENAQDLVSTVKNKKGNSSYNSRGITQLKLGSYTDPDVKRLMKDYRITPDNLGEPENAAIGTMIVLSCIYKNELPALKSLMEEQGITNEDALLYCFNGRKSEIRNRTATPQKNEYIQSVNKYERNFNLKQSGC